MAVEVFSRTKRLSEFPHNFILEMLSFSSKFCCEEMKHACDTHLASLVLDMDDAMLLIEYGLEETAYLLVAACLQVFLRELPGWDFLVAYCSKFPTSTEKHFDLHHSVSGSFGSEEHASIVYAALIVDKELQPDKVKRGMTDDDAESSFRPNFAVPESLLHNLPPNEKIHQIISRTAMFVCKHGSQSEILLRVKQGDNPNAYRISLVRTES
ncbi:hypothetical protein LR48_Vigan01g084700 [Vigna angularis]|uniref:SURP motif domain-containing protein n=1 Tax=Phaseolus angularis TaxID=3914 RepID=A0A0L9TLG2_PHAAN|nr:hypothetical protein LR48_Vigan01g084700 [Vigna angularis]